MKNPKLIDEAWIDEQIQYVGNPNNKYDDALLHLMNLVKSKLQPIPAKNNVEKVRAGEMAIENDDKEVLKKCCAYLFDDGRTVVGNYKYYYAWEKHLNRWQANNTTDLPTIKASELIKDIEWVHPIEIMYPSDEPVKRKFNFTKPDTEPEPEWQPKFGEVVETRDNDIQDWDETIYLGTKDGKHHCVGYKEENQFNLNENYSVTTWNQIRQKQTPTLTLAEAEAKLGVKIIMP